MIVRISMAEKKLKIKFITATVIIVLLLMSLSAMIYFAHRGGTFTYSFLLTLVVIIGSIIFMHKFSDSAMKAILIFILEISLVISIVLFYLTLTSTFYTI
jgi:hypothetical protein